MDIAIYVGIYTAIVATATLVWVIIQVKRRRVIVKVWQGVKKDDSLYITVINKTGEQVKIWDIGFGCQSGFGFLVSPEPHFPVPMSIDNKKCELPITLENNARCVFWLSKKEIKRLKKEHGENIVCALVEDFQGREHKGRIPRSIKKMLNS